MNIPEQLRKKEFDFVLIKEGQKAPFEKDWPNTRNYKYHATKLTKHLKNGGNYGVLLNRGDLIVIDCDWQEVVWAVQEHLPPTFTVLSGGRQLPQYYYKCRGVHKKPLKDVVDIDGESVMNEKGKQEHYGEIMGIGSQIVGPGSRTAHEYRVIKDLPIAEVTKEQVLKALEMFLPEKKERVTQKIAEGESTEQVSKLDISITDVCSTAGLGWNGVEFQGSHPLHGSSTKQNFTINPHKNTWYCFRHGVGGGPLEWVAVREGILDCSQIGPGCLSGELFKQVLQKAYELTGKTEKVVKADVEEVSW